MNEKEYREFLEALGRRQLNFLGERFGPGGSDLFRHDLKRLAQTHRFVQVVRDRPHDLALYRSLGEELVKGDAQRVFAAMTRTGVIDALDEYGQIIFSNLSKDVLPAEEADFLRAAGIAEPEAELVILVYESQRLAQAPDFRSSAILQRASARLAEVAEELESMPQSPAVPQAKPRKYFNGIAKILSGAILGGGNLLIGTGTVIASGGAVGAAVIASCAAAVTAVGQGVGDLRGE